MLKVCQYKLYTSFLKLKWQDRVTGRGAEYPALAFFCILN